MQAGCHNLHPRSCDNRRVNAEKLSNWARISGERGVVLIGVPRLSEKRDFFAMIIRMFSRSCRGLSFTTPSRYVRVTEMRSSPPEELHRDGDCVNC